MLRFILLASVFANCFAHAALAHTQLATPLKKRYQLRTVSCAACHAKDQEEKTRDALTDFGKEIAKVLEGKQISDRIAAAKDLPSDQRKSVFAEIEKEYLEALDKLDALPAPSGKPYADAIPAGEMEGTKPR
jgi:hypothetical protein